MKNLGLTVLTAAMLFAGAAAAFAADSDKPKTFTVTLRNGKVLQDAYILDKKPNGITLAYKEGCMFIPFSDMPLEYQQKFGYDPIKSARYEKQQDEKKKAAEKEERERKAKAEKRKAEEEKRSRDQRVLAQQQRVRKLELELDEAKKRLNMTEQTIRQDRSSLGMSSFDSGRACIESPWGYGERIRSGAHNAAVTNRLLKEVDTMSAKRDNQAQDVIDLQLKLEAAQRTLDELLDKQ
jgi:flagellar biosynthesis GTPase FlhF